MWTGTISADNRNSTPRGWCAQWVFTSRVGGTSSGVFSSMNLADHVDDDPERVTANRNRLAAGFGGVVPRLAILGAAHGAEVGVAHQNSAQVFPGCDGLVTTETGIAVVALAADCVPVVLADVEHGVVAAVHCGWQGLVAGVIEATARRMSDSGATSESVRAVVGPAICGRCYGVPGQRLAAVVDVVPEAASQTALGEPAIDVRAGVMAQLAGLGIASQLVGGCTAESDDLFSFRRDGRTGRQSGAIVLRAA